MKDNRKFLEEIENKLDEVNGEYGSKDELCIFCKANKYNSKVGIVHAKDCVIMRLREALKAGNNTLKRGL